MSWSSVDSVDSVDSDLIYICIYISLESLTLNSDNNEHQYLTLNTAITTLLPP